MALDDLIARLERDADAQVKAIASEADDEIAAIAAATEQALAARARERLAAAHIERQLEYTRALVDRRRQIRAIELTERHALVERVFARARESAADGRQLDEWTTVWPAIVEEALSYAGAVPCRVRATPPVAAVLRAAGYADGRLEIVEDLQIGAGLVLEAIDQSVRIDATIDGLLAQRRAQLAIGLLADEADDGA
jgi:vacuolar-type H+-ATPase subunit E/Vma4